MISKQMVAWGERGCSIREIAAYGERRAAEIGPENVYNFAIGNPSIDPPDCVQEAVERLLRTVPPAQLHAYAPAPGMASVREKVAAYLTDTFGEVYRAQDIYMTDGASSALAILTRALMGPGDEAIVFAPYFPEYAVYAEAAGGSVRVVPCRADTFALDLDALAAAVTEKTALLILMAQMGSYVPAKSAHIGYVDKIFTRVGASDNISQGESTFMVEMLESASILNNISDRSIVLLDEIGRGTSTYDGISIAWAMVEYLHNHPSARAKTLFATHYHELNEMEQMCSRVKNYHVSVKEMGNQIVFLRKLERGGTEHSFGIHVARMAGMPVSIVSRADEILRNLELVYGNNEIVPSRSLKERGRKSAAQAVKEAAESAGPQNMQLSMFQLDDPVLVQIRDQIKGLDINSLTPIEALNKLNEIKKITGI